MADLKMPDLNTVIIAGRLTRDPELKYTASNKAYCKISIANSRRFRSQGASDWQEETTFVDATVWGVAAETIAQKMVKGCPVIVEGRLRTSEWEDKTTGQKRSRVEINAERVTSLEWPSDGNSKQQTNQPDQPRKSDHYGAEFAYAPATAEDEIPF